MDSLLQTVAALRQLLTNLQHACGWQPHKVSLLGFSQVTAIHERLFSLSHEVGHSRAGTKLLG